MVMERSGNEDEKKGRKEKGREEEEKEKRRRGKVRREDGCLGYSLMVEIINIIGPSETSILLNRDRERKGREVERRGM